MSGAPAHMMKTPAKAVSIWIGHPVFSLAGPPLAVTCAIGSEGTQADRRRPELFVRERRGQW